MSRSSDRTSGSGNRSRRAWSTTKWKIPATSRSRDRNISSGRRHGSDGTVTPPEASGRGLSSCSVLDWAGGWQQEEEEEKEKEKKKKGKGKEKGGGHPEAGRHRVIPTPEELKGFIDRLRIDDDDGGENNKNTKDINNNNNNSNKDSGGTVATMQLSTTSFIDGNSVGEEEKKKKKDKDYYRKPMVILHGLPSMFLAILLDSGLGIDPGFIEAHAWRRRYHPPPRHRRQQRRRRGRGGDMDAAEYGYWNYPELVCGFKKTIRKKKSGNIYISQGGRGGLARTAVVKDTSAQIDFLDDPAIRSVSDAEDLAAVFCRASLWVTPGQRRVAVLFLERPVWDDPDGYMKKAIRKGGGALMKPYLLKEKRVYGKNNNNKDHEEWTVHLARGENIPDFETVLQDILMSSSSTTTATTTSSVEDEEDVEVDLVDTVEETAYEHWLDFFEALTPRQCPLVYDGTSLEWRALQALEGNMVMANELVRRGQRKRDDSRHPDWSALIQGLRMRVEMLPTIPPRPALQSAFPGKKRATASLLLPPTTTSSSSLPKYQFSYDQTLGRVPIPTHRKLKQTQPIETQPSSPTTTAPPSGGDENQRALDRVTYLGGIVLPISLVSSILSMNEDFEPGQPFFWVFWAVSVPLTVLTIVVIYADKLRRAEVWVEVSIAGGSSDSGSEGGGKEDEDEDGKDKKEEKYSEGGYSMLRFRPHAGAPALLASCSGGGGTAAIPGQHPETITYSSDGDHVVVIDLSGSEAQEPETSGPHTGEPVEPPSSSPLPPEHSEDGAQESSSSEREERNEYDYRNSSDDSTNDDEEEEGDEEEEVVVEEETGDPNMVFATSADGRKPHAWRRKQLGWVGAAKCILKLQQPKLRVEDGLPVKSIHGQENQLHTLRRRRGRRSRNEILGEAGRV